MKEGDNFTAGDILLEIVSRLSSKNDAGSGLNTYVQETDKATMDVEAQDDGVVGKIIVRLLHEHNYTLTDLSVLSDR